jgi:catechol 2,3-dioxygenase-like lactoylglutathione lyase family enzyme
MIDHVSIGVRDLEESVRFYEGALRPLGYRKLDVRPDTVGFGKRYSELWINLRPDLVRLGSGLVSGLGSGAHVALRARSIEAVDAFYAAALQSGGTCDGAPGPRPQYSPGYYAAFVRDPDGNCIEAVTFVQAET